MLENLSLGEQQDDEFCVGLCNAILGSLDMHGHGVSQAPAHGYRATSQLISLLRYQFALISAANQDDIIDTLGQSGKLV